MRTVIIHTVTTATDAIKPNRDAGKVFILTEMSARKGHDWATKALFAAMNSGLDIPPEMLSMGMAGIAVMGMSGFTRVPHAVAKPLLDELLECVQIKQELVTRPPVDEDYEEISTLFELQRMVFSMHIEPFTSVKKPTSVSPPTIPAQAA